MSVDVALRILEAIGLLGFGYCAAMLYGKIDLGEAAWWRSCYDGLTKDSDSWETQAHFHSDMSDMLIDRVAKLENREPDAIREEVVAKVKVAWDKLGLCYTRQARGPVKDL